MEPHYNLLSTSFNICGENLEQIVEDAKDYAVYKGILMRTPDFPKDVRAPLPFCLVPSHYPQKWFQQACELQPYLNHILFKISHSKSILKECLAGTIEADEFTSNIFKIFEAVDRESQMSLGLIRSDYLLDSDASGNIVGIKQVENNTISSSFGALAPQIQDLHEFVLDRLGQKSLQYKLPQNTSAYELAKGLLCAWDEYGRPGAAILFVVEEVTFNISDQRILEYTMMEFFKEVEIIRCTFKELRSCAKLRGRQLLVKDKEVAVVYYRVGYMPDHYELEDWETRLLMERSSAIKCPSAGLHLAGTKRVQAYLTQPGVLETFVEHNIAKKLREVFAKQYALEMGKEGDEAVALGIANPQKYVLKPEREGGGNNIYGSGVKNVLESVGSSDKRKAYILMERIFPPGLPNCIVQRNKPPKIENVICELGVFGVILGSKDEVIINKFAGHLLRSKGMYSNEGGIAAGFGALDSPFLE